MTSKERLKEEWIAVRCQLGESEAFRELINLMEARLSYYIRRFIKDEHTAWDILQEVWLVVFQKIKKLRNTSAIRGWLYRITHDKIANYLRDKKIEEKALNELAYKDMNDQITFSETEASQIHQLLDKINPVHREALVLYFIEGMEYEEIADVIKCSIGTVKSRLHYAKNTLRALMNVGDK
jgi:RNA polymerase sigma-70 factor (ECF subfamily)